MTQISYFVAGHLLVSLLFVLSVQVFRYRNKVSGQTVLPFLSMIFCAAIWASFLLLIWNKILDYNGAGVLEFIQSLQTPTMETTTLWFLFLFAFLVVIPMNEIAVRFVQSFTEEVLDLRYDKEHMDSERREREIEEDKSAYQSSTRELYDQYLSEKSRTFSFQGWLGQIILGIPRHEVQECFLYKREEMKRRHAIVAGKERCES